MIDVDIYVRGSASAVTRSMTGVGADAGAWTDADVRALIAQMLVAIDRERNPGGDAPVVALRGFSWIVSPDAGGVLVHLEMQTGSASAGPFTIAESRLSDMIARVIATAGESDTVH